jgi:glycosyltransferase involved in cell wall biosynthesis
MTASVESWLQKWSGKARPWFPAVSGLEPDWRGVAVIIPLFNEVFSPTLESLKAATDFAAKGTQSQGRNGEVRLYCVVNNRRNDRPEVKEGNQELLARLNRAARNNTPGFNLIVIDAASQGREIPEGQGVGFARKIGMDFALLQGAQVIACLDGDTLVSEEYISILHDFMRRAHPVDAGCLSFLHQPGETPEAEQAVRRYEGFLAEHSRKLKACGSIYYQTALTPRIVCTKEAYMQSGGMNTRAAGEDFYFLQALTKVCYGKGRLPITLPAEVYPSARVSDRVPFGTGQKIGAILAGAALPAYSDFVYEQIGAFIALVNGHIQGDEPIAALQSHVSELLPGVQNFLDANKFFTDWEKIRANMSGPAGLTRAFQFWFDGLRIIRLIHHLAAGHTAASIAEYRSPGGQ